jgi:hypothetical protein
LTGRSWTFEQLAAKHWWPVLKPWRGKLGAQATQQKWPKLEHWRRILQLEQLVTKHWWPSLEFLIVIWICLEMSMTVLATHHFAFSLHDLKFITDNG